MGTPIHTGKQNDEVLNVFDRCVIGFPKGLLFFWEIKNESYLKFSFWVWGSVFLFQQGREHSILDPEEKAMTLIKDRVAMWVSWMFYFTSSNLLAMESSRNCDYASH